MEEYGFRQLVKVGLKQLRETVPRLAALKYFIPRVKIGHNCNAIF